AARRWRRRRSSRSIATSGRFPGRLAAARHETTARVKPALPPIPPDPPPLRRQHRVDDLVGPFALDDLVLAEMRLAPHAELLHDPGRRDVATVAARHDAVQPELVETKSQHGRAGLAREPAAVM